MKSTFHCPTCGKDRPLSQELDTKSVPAHLLLRMQADNPQWDGKKTCRPDLRRYRVLLLREAFEAEHGAVGSVEERVLSHMAQGQHIARNVDLPADSLGVRVADSVARFGGSWTFLGLFGGIILLWMATNAVILTRAFDPYPFILLNLVLSCLAAMQAPVIMMSQNRTAAKDRERAEHDYEVNFKAELEVQLLNEKLDHLLLREWQKLLEIQQFQLEMLEELADPPSRG